MSTLCKDIERKWERHEMKLHMDEYTAHTYRELFELEAKRRTKGTPLCYQKPDGLFASSDCHSGVFSL